MIIVRLHNGLGNQMFQYAAGLALAHHHQTALKLDLSWFDSSDRKEHEHYGLNHFNIPEVFADREECLAFMPKSLTRLQRWRFILGKKLRLKPLTAGLESSGTYYFERRWGFNPLFWDLPSNTYLDGYFQNPTYFEGFENELRSRFSFQQPLSAGALVWSNKIQSAFPSVFLHIRRTDYLQAQEFGPLTFDYYYRSLKELKDRLGAFTVFVFSDDVEAIQRELKLDLPHYFVKPDGKASSHEELHLMSLCNHAIISNSTFAWWGAWLNSSKEKIVVAPKPWHADIDPQFRDLKPVPSSWLSIDRNGVSNF